MGESPCDDGRGGEQSGCIALDNADTQQDRSSQRSRRPLHSPSCSPGHRTCCRSSSAPPMPRASRIIVPTMNHRTRCRLAAHAHRDTHGGDHPPGENKPTNATARDNRQSVCSMARRRETSEAPNAADSTCNDRERQAKVGTQGEAGNVRVHASILPDIVFYTNKTPPKNQTNIEIQSTVPRRSSAAG